MTSLYHILNTEDNGFHADRESLKRKHHEFNFNSPELQFNKRAKAFNLPPLLLPQHAYHQGRLSPLQALPSSPLAQSPSPHFFGSPYHSPTKSYAQALPPVARLDIPQTVPMHQASLFSSFPVSPASSADSRPSTPSSTFCIVPFQPSSSRPGTPSSAGSPSRRESKKRVLVVPSELMQMRQAKAAVKLGIPPSTFSKRWRESLPERKWPYRLHKKIEKSIRALNVLQSKGQDVSEEMRRLRAHRESNLQPAHVLMFEEVNMDYKIDDVASSTSSCSSASSTASPPIQGDGLSRLADAGMMSENDRDAGSSSGSDDDDDSSLGEESVVPFSRAGGARF